MQPRLSMSVKHTNNFLVYFSHSWANDDQLRLRMPVLEQISNPAGNMSSRPSVIAVICGPYRYLPLVVEPHHGDEATVLITPLAPVGYGDPYVFDVIEVILTRNWSTSRNATRQLVEKEASTCRAICSELTFLVEDARPSKIPRTFRGFSLPIIQLSRNERA